MKKTVALPVSQAKEGRKTSALEKSLIRFFERELEVKLTRREMWRSVRFVASLFVLLLTHRPASPCWPCRRSHWRLTPIGALPT